MTGKSDMDECIALLESANWDLNVAVNGAMEENNAQDHHVEDYHHVAPTTYVCACVCVFKCVIIHIILIIICSDQASDTQMMEPLFPQMFPRIGSMHTGGPGGSYARLLGDNDNPFQMLIGTCVCIP
jgi:hypothetical protein